MKRTKIAVYAICKNEIEYVDKWVANMSEADYIVVLDTGSTDGTYEKLQTYPNVLTFQKEIKPWRFDVARNEALKLVPSDADVLVSVDLDELFNKGWGKALRKYWDNDMGMLRYYYVANLTDEGLEGITFYRDKIHANDYDTYHWKHRVHEVLTRPDNLPIYFINEIKCIHHQNLNTNRKSYLPLLEEEYKEYPNDLRIQHLLGREYYANKQYKKAIETLEQMVSNAAGNYPNEVYNGLEYIGESWEELGELDDAIAAYRRAIKVAPYFRSAHLKLALVYLIQNRPGDALKQVGEALKIGTRMLLFADDPDAWREKPYVIAHSAFKMMGMEEEADTMIRKIESVNPNFPLLSTIRTN